MKVIIPYVRLHLYQTATGCGAVLGLSSQPLRRGVRCCDRHKGTGRAIDLEPLTNATAEAGSSMGWVVHPDHTIREVLMHRQPHKTIVHEEATRARQR